MIMLTINMNDIKGIEDNCDIFIQITSIEVELYINAKIACTFQLNDSSVKYIRILSDNICFGSFHILNKSKFQTDIFFKGDCYTLNLFGFNNGQVDIESSHITMINAINTENIKISGGNLSRIIAPYIGTLDIKIHTVDKIKVFTTYFNKIDSYIGVVDIDRSKVYSSSAKNLPITHINDDVFSYIASLII